MAQTTPVPGPNTQTGASPGVAVIAIDTNQSGGYIVNPLTSEDQGFGTGGVAEPLYVNQVTGATIVGNGTTIVLAPGQSYTVIPYTTTAVTVASPTPNHKFTAVQWP